MEEKEAHEVLYLAEKLLAVEEGTLVLFRDMVPEMLCSSRLYYTYTHTGGTK